MTADQVPASPKRRRNAGSTAAYPIAQASLPGDEVEAGSYLVRFARESSDLDALLRLRYQVFNLELGEGLDSSHLSGRDEDELDARFHHLLIVSRKTDEVVGTYRMQTGEMARSGAGFYSDQEFDLSLLPDAVVADAVEIGRACVAREHRNGRVLHLLWRGLALYLTWNRKRYLFGCCSVNSQDPEVGLAVHAHLETIDAVHRDVRVMPRPGYECRRVGPPTASPPASHVPALFQTYLALGAKACGPPAIDRDFKTIDWLVMLDVGRIDPATHRAFFR
ncbi:MAG: GNAT family N-acetyltransferase [Gemmatimonadales bacterium]